MISMQRLKIIGDRGQPCLMPARTGIGVVVPFGVLISVEAPVYTLEIRSINDLGIPM